MKTDYINRDPMTAEAVAREIGISRSAAYMLFKQADFPAIRITTKRVICFREDFERWLAAKQEQKNH